MELVLSAALLVRKSAGEGVKIVFQIFSTLVLMRALSILHESTCRRLVRELYPMKFL
jgi:ribosomal protein L19